MPNAVLIEKRTIDPLIERIRWLGLVGALAGLVIVGRAAQIQLIGDERIEGLSRRQFQSRVIVRPRRGPVLDRVGEAMAVNVETKSLAANPSKLGDRQKSLVRSLARALEIPPGKLTERIKNKRREFVWIKRHLTDGDVARMKRWGLMDDNAQLSEGLWLVKESRRVYPQGELASHVLGSVNVDSEGLEGVELWANSVLQGRGAPIRVVRDALGRNSFVDTQGAQQVEDGSPVELSIDASLQFAVEQDLKQSIAKTKSRAGSVIVMNAEDGEIFALANYPTFNPDQLQTQPVSGAYRRNRALTDGYEPGSTLKPLVLGVALRQGMRLSDRLHGDNGSIVIQGHRIGEAEAHERFQWISLEEMIRVSSNVVAAKLALRLGTDRVRQGLEELGLGSTTQSGFPGEATGILPRAPWQPIRLANVGFGHGLLVTPLQIARAYAAIANGGWLVQPTFFKRPWNGYRQTPPKRVWPEGVAQEVTQALVGATQAHGTGTKAVLEGFEVAGKTGTSQMLDPTTGAYSRSRYVASFVGFLARTPQKIVIMTQLQEPSGLYYASETAAPLFRAVLQSVVNRFAIPSTEEPPRLAADRIRWSLAKVTPATPDVVPAPVAEAERSAPEPQAASPLSSAPAPDPVVPELVGLSAREALQAIAALPLSARDRPAVELVGFGVVQSQSPAAGTRLEAKARIKLALHAPSPAHTPLRPR